MTLDNSTKLVELFHDSDGKAYATTSVDGCTQTVPVKSEAYRTFVRLTAYQAGDTLSPTEIKRRIETDAMHAQFDGEEHHVFIRVGYFDGHVFTGMKAKSQQRIYVDLADDGSAVEITAKGWKVVAVPACKFRRAAGMLSLPTPVPGDIHLLRPFVNLGDEDYFLFLTTLIAAFRFGRPTPITLVTGEHGSGKTTLARIFRKLVDPSSAPVQTASNNERDLQIAAANSWVVNIDNQSKLNDALSDNLCRLATGSGLRTRQLYTDSDETIFNAVRPILMNSIEELATRPDFLDRTIHLHTHEIPKSKRRPEEEMWAEFDSVAPQILGGLMTAVSCAMKNVASVSGDFPRMADYARWSVAAAPALGFTGEDFLRGYDANRKRSTHVALDASPIYLPLHKVLDDGNFRGTTKELLNELMSWRHKYRDSEASDLPRTPRALAAELTRLTPNLRADGVTVKRVGRDSTRRVEILEVTRVWTDKELALEKKQLAPSASAVGVNSLALSKRLQNFIADVLKQGACKRRDIRRMVEGQMPIPNGVKPPLFGEADKNSATLNANATALGVVTVDRGEDGIWWSLPEKEKEKAASAT